MKNREQKTKRKKLKASITIMMPAYNEEKHLENSVRPVNRILSEIFEDYEILIFNDCSTDKTGEIADKLAKENRKVRVVHNQRNRGLGYNYRAGVKLASKEYYCWIPGDMEENPIVIRSMTNLFWHTGEADIVTSYYKFKIPRPFYRDIISIIFTWSLNLLFLKRIRYYCGLTITRTDAIRKVKMTTDSFAMQAEVMIQLLKMGYSYKQYPMYQLRDHGTSAMFRWKNAAGVAWTVIRLFFEQPFMRRRRKNVRSR